MIHNEDENITKVKWKRRDKLNIWGAISYNWEISLEIFEDNIKFWELYLNTIIKTWRNDDN